MYTEEYYIKREQYLIFPNTSHYKKDLNGAAKVYRWLKVESDVMKGSPDKPRFSGKMSLLRLALY
ncbi:hypothetical protein DPMN_038952 [Dreissena polymorpha]|uniref:Uncharacterized protein n=1 Tax=Dreissena polymorpha TaxID=45954 RepID=A0A9D4MFM3_DREPO|nr:hypothetical protein DPMN_038952 [Dreissena polymorpha]